MAYLIGVDSGGTKTKAAAYNLEGRKLAEVSLGSGNISLDYAKTIQTIKEAIQTVQEQIPGSCQTILLGIAGVETAQLVPKVKDTLSSLGKKIYVVNDAKLAFITKLKGNDGILVTAGTGSIVFARVKSQEYRVGGWGHLLGDEGSGYWIGLQCYKQVVHELDAGVSLSDFSRKFITYQKASSPLEVVQSVYQLDKKRVAENAEFVSAMASSNDETAVNILQSAGKELGKMVLQLIKRIGEDDGRQLAMAGSVLEKNDIVRQSFEACILEKKIEIIYNNEENTKAVWYDYRDGE